MLELLDYRRRVSELYALIRRLGTNSPVAFHAFKQERDKLFAQHPASPLSDEQRLGFQGLQVAPYDPRFRVTGAVKRITASQVYHDENIESGSFRMRPFGTFDVTLPTGQGQLTLYWIEGYGGGIFLPFRDASNGSSTYGGGRYLLDSIKGTDLGTEGGRLILDFNYSYHPSCAYNDRWVCPLAPKENHLHFSIPVGELLPSSVVKRLPVDTNLDSSGISPTAADDVEP